MGTTGCVRPTVGAPGGHTAAVSTGGGGRIERQTAGTPPEVHRPNTWPQSPDEDMGQAGGEGRAPAGGHQGHHLREP
eukprot:5673339-Pyramimonas_sp.AAC.1